VAGDVVTAEELLAEAAARGVAPETREDWRALRDELVRHRLLVSAARREGLHRDPAYVRAVERMLANKYLQQELTPQLETVVVAEEEVAAFYEAHRDEMLRPERFEGAVLLVASPARAVPAAREQARQRAEKALREARGLPASDGFGDVARRYSDDTATRYLGGRMGWVYRHRGASYRWPAPVVEALFGLVEPGETSEVIATDEGFWIVRLVRREAAEAVPLERMAAGLRTRLLRERREAAEQRFYDGLAEELGVEVRDSVLDALPLAPATPRPAQEPPPLPPG
jgi:parvulin-like peptidyl-prolyl isomerase